MNPMAHSYFACKGDLIFENVYKETYNHLKDIARDLLSNCV